MLTGIFHAAALQSMQYEFVITFVTVVRHLTADPLFLLAVQNTTPQLTVSAVTVPYGRDDNNTFLWPATRIQKSCMDPFSMLQVHEPCDDNPRPSGSPWQPEGSDTLATSCLLHSACRRLKHMSLLCVNCVCARTIRSNNNGRCATKRSVNIVSLFRNDGFRVIFVKGEARLIIINRQCLSSICS